ncbi:hypothetical protein [Nostoc sp. CCY0012]|uniref:hypothetical protein n=1 Tax=Nostoc sp. CCY0012 TaxID=1056123 RepID=UPI0039C61006
MANSSFEAQSQALQRLDFDLHITANEWEIKQNISACLEPIPQLFPPVPDNSVYSFNKILDALD